MGRAIRHVHAWSRNVGISPDKVLCKQRAFLNCFAHRCKNVFYVFFILATFFTFLTLFLFCSRFFLILNNVQGKSHQKLREPLLGPQKRISRS